MITTKVQIEINRPAQDVFNFIIEPSNAVLWQLTTAEVTGEPGAPAGSVGQVVTQVFGQRLTSRYEILENDGRGYLHAKSSQGPLRFDTMQRVVPTKRGCQVILATSIDAGTVFKLAETALESIARARFESDLKTLKALMENQD